MSQFSERLKLLRNEKGITQGELAKALCTSKSTVGMMETDKRNPSLSLYEDIADYFNVDMDYLLGKQNMKRKVNLDNYLNENDKAASEGTLLADIYHNKELFDEIKKLVALPVDKQGYIFNQINYLYSQEQEN